MTDLRRALRGVELDGKTDESGRSGFAVAMSPFGASPTVSPASPLPALTQRLGVPAFERPSIDLGEPGKRPDFKTLVAEAHRDGYERGKEAAKARLDTDTILQALLKRTDISRVEKAKFVKKRIAELRLEMSALDGKVAANHQRVEDIQKEIEALDREKFALDEMIPWAKLVLTLERAEETRLHSFLTDAKNDRIVYFSRGDERTTAKTFARSFDEDTQTFIVQHDWGRAFAGAQDFGDGPFRLPYARCCFEFRISGRAVLALAMQDDDSVVSVAPVVRARDCWTVAMRPYVISGADEFDEGDGYQGLVYLLGSQIRAVSIALDAEVAATEIIRAPHKLNLARAKRGAIPVFDYRIVQLANRKRRAALPATEARTLRQKRLHFRRGHWRHYEAHKTWIKWMLVGDPDAGFIEKEYRL